MEVENVFKCPTHPEGSAVAPCPWPCLPSTALATCRHSNGTPLNTHRLCSAKSLPFLPMLWSSLRGPFTHLSVRTGRSHSCLQSRLSPSSGGIRSCPSHQCRHIPASFTIPTTSRGCCQENELKEQKEKTGESRKPMDSLPKSEAGPPGPQEEHKSPASLSLFPAF